MIRKNLIQKNAQIIKDLHCEVEFQNFIFEAVVKSTDNKKIDTLIQIIDFEAKNFEALPSYE